MHCLKAIISYQNQLNPFILRIHQEARPEDQFLWRIKYQKINLLNPKQTPPPANPFRDCQINIASQINNHPATQIPKFINKNANEFDIDLYI